MTDWDDNPLVYVTQSPIHGRGVFARRPIAAGTFIGRYDGEQTRADGMHVLWVEGDNEDEWIGFDGTNELRFLNHSATPNGEMDGQDLYAARDIPRNEEVTIDYGEWFEAG
jgi:SET domain-containing protein